MRTLLSLAFVLSVLTLARAEILPVEDFSHESAYYGVTLSPDGKAVVYGETIKGENRLFVVDLTTGKKFGIDLEGYDNAWSNGSNFAWANNNRIVFTAHGRRAAIDRDGHNARYYLPGGDAIHYFRNDEGTLLTLGYDIAVATGLRNVSYMVPNRPFVARVNTRTGIPMREEENPGNVVAWGVSPDGVINIAVEIKGTRYRMLYRSDAKAAWTTLPGMDWGDPQALPVMFSPDGKTLFVTRISPAGTWGIYRYDIVNRRLGEAVLTNDRYDVLPGHNLAFGNDIPLEMPVYSMSERRILGFRYLTEYPRMHWLDPELAEVQAALDQALPQKINSVVSLSDDRQKMVVFSWTATDPGTYYLFDRSAQKLEKFLAARPWIDSRKMSDVVPVRFKARDGLMLNGYLTLPRGREKTGLPLVVLPHRDPWARSVWEFDQTAQFLANRGYAVLQVNHRGSSGSGESFRDAARLKMGRDVQFDIADGAKWAVRQKIADPARIAIVGLGGYAGYDALMGLALEPDLYCCGVASAPYADWAKIVDKSEMIPDTYTYLTEWIGDPAVDKQALRQISPVNLTDQMKAPLLLMHSSQDDDWYFNQTKAVANHLKKAGRDVEFHTKYDDLRYGYQRHAKFLSEIEVFLGKHMPSGVH